MTVSVPIIGMDSKKFVATIYFLINLNVRGEATTHCVHEVVQSYAQLCGYFLRLIDPQYKYFLDR